MAKIKDRLARKSGFSGATIAPEMVKFNKLKDFTVQIWIFYHILCSNFAIPQYVFNAKFVYNQGNNKN
jgi:hypothetical protein